jgi:hypothetical protein
MQRFKGLDCRSGPLMQRLINARQSLIDETCITLVNWLQAG